MPQPLNELIPTRASLLKRLREWQDQNSWQEFFDTYRQLIYHTARKAGLSDAEAKDVVQETMIAVAKRMPSFKYDPAIGSFKTWLLNIARWRIIDHLRQCRASARHQSRNPEYAVLDDTATAIRPVEKVVDPKSLELDALWDAEWEKTLFAAAVAKVKRGLDPQKFQMFDLYVNKGWEPEKVAKTFNVPVGQVYLAKHRVLATIKAEVRRLKQNML